VRSRLRIGNVQVGISLPMRFKWTKNRLIGQRFAQSKNGLDTISFMDNIHANEICAADSRLPPSVTLRHAFHAAQLNAAATATILVPAKTSVDRQGALRHRPSFFAHMPGRMPILTAYPIAR